MIDAQARIDAALDALQAEEGVRLLLAVESGSRAWGFPSRDSDYDVRCIFVRPAADYLRVSSPRDVIERPIADSLDLGGWDARKALGAVLRSNAVIREWLCSPVTYRVDPGAKAALGAIARDAVQLPAVVYHYDRLARRAWAAGTGDMSLKSYCYALRAVLALCWTRERETAPPMDLPTLREGMTLAGNVEEAIDQLLAQKAESMEADTTARLIVLDAFLAANLAEPVARPVATDPIAARQAADALFRSLVDASI